MRRIHAAWSRAAATTLTFLAATSLARSAEAEPPAWRFVYESRDLEPGSRCPSPSQVRSQVVARLGFDPFHELRPVGAGEETTPELWITIHRDDRGLRALVERRDDGSVVGERTLRAGSDCAELAAAAALAGSILVDPTGAMAKRQASRREPAPTGTTRAEDPWREVDPPRLEPAHESRAARLEALLGVRAIGSAGLAPAPSFGLSLDGALRWQRFEVRLEGRGDLPVSAEPLPDGAGVATTLVFGSVVPCWVNGWLRLCGVLSAGAMFARSENLSPVERDATFFGAVGVRPMLDVPLGGAFHLVGSVEGVLPVRNLSLTVRGNEVWSSSVVAGAAGLGLQMHLL